jgi:hypothetical protein
MEWEKRRIYLRICERQRNSTKKSFHLRQRDLYSNIFNIFGALYPEQSRFKWKFVRKKLKIIHHTSWS